MNEQKGSGGKTGGAGALAMIGLFLMLTLDSDDSGTMLAMLAMISGAAAILGLAYAIYQAVLKKRKKDEPETLEAAGEERPDAAPESPQEQTAQAPDERERHGEE